MQKNHTLKKRWFATGIIASLLAVNLTSYAFADELDGADNWVTSSLVESQEQETNTFYQVDGKWYCLDENGELATGWQIIDGKILYFNADGSQVKGEMVSIDGAAYYFDQDTGEMWTNRFVEQILYNNYYKSYYTAWFYLGEDGKIVTGRHTINGQELFFYSSGIHAKGKSVEINGNVYYFDPDTGEIWKNRYVHLSMSNYYYYNPTVDKWVYLDENGVAINP